MANSNFVVKNGLTVNGSFTANSTVVNASAITATSVNATTLSIGGTSVATLITSNASAAYTNATSYVDGKSYVNSAQLNSNLNNYAALTGATFSGPLNVTSNVTITGNLIVTGTTLYANVTNLDVKDLNITVAKGVATAAAADGAGLTVDTANVTWNYNNATNSWQSNVGITPSTNNNLNIGTIGLVWANVYANNVVGTTVYGTLATASQPNITANNSTNFAGFPASSYVTNTYMQGLGYANSTTSVTVNAAVYQTGGGLGTTANGVYVNATSIFIGNSQTNATINSTSFTGTSSNATNLGGVPSTSYVNTSGTYTITGIHTHQANVVVGNTTVNTQFSNSIVLISNATSTTTINLTDIRIGNTTSNVVLSNTVSSFSGNVSITGVANVTGNVTLGSSAFFVGNGTYLTTVNATNITVGTLPYAQLGTNVVNTTANFTITGIHTHQANVVVGNTTVNTQFSNSIVLISNATSTTTINLTDIRIGNTTSNVVLSNTVSSFSGNVSITGVANVTGNVTLGSSAFFVGNGTYLTTVNATNITVGTLPYAQLGTNVVNTTANFTITGMHTYSNGITFSNTVTANGSNGTAGQVLTSAGATGNAYWSTASSVNTAAQWTWTNTHLFQANVQVNAYFSVTNSTSNIAFFAANGNVGIGTTSPGQKLSVIGTSGDVVAFTGTSGSSVSTTLYGTNGDNRVNSVGYGPQVQGGRYPGFSATYYSSNNTGGDAGGFPTAELYRYGGNTSIAFATASGLVIGGFNTWGSNATTSLSATRIEGISEAAFTTAATAGIRFQTTNAGTQSEVVRFSANGNVGVGTSSPNKPLEINVSASPYQLRMGYSTNYYDIGRSASDGLMYFYGSQTGFTGYVFSGADGERARIAANGNVGIGTSTPGYKLEINGNAKVGTGGLTFSSGATQYNAGMSWLGTYSASTTYKPNDVVFYQGINYSGLYIAKTTTLNNTPTDGSTSTYWAVMLFFNTTSAGGGGGGGGESPSG